MLAQFQARYGLLPKEPRHLALIGECEWPKEVLPEHARKAYAWIGDDRGKVRVISHRLFVAFLKKRFSRWFAFDLHKTLLPPDHRRQFHIPKFEKSQERLTVASVTITPRQWATKASGTDGRTYHSLIDVAFYERPIDPAYPREQNTIVNRVDWYIFRGPRVHRD